MKKLIKRLVGAGFAVVTGCATVPIPSEQLARAEGALRAAEEIGAPKSPPAALHLQLAKDEIQQSKTMIQKGENKRATMRLTRAEADAELALALARASNVRAEADASENKAKGGSEPRAIAPTK